MTIATENYRNSYNGDCSTTTFQYSFRILDQSHLAVYVDGTLKTITADYTVSGVDAASGGNVVLNSPPGCGKLVVIQRDAPFTQTTAYTEGGRFPASSHEKALDKLTMLAQQLLSVVQRSWRFAVGSSYAASGYEVDEPKGGAYVRIKSDCSGVEYVTLENCGTYANPVTTKGDLIRGGDVGEQERFGIGTAGYVVTSHPDTGKPAWSAGGSISLRNKLDAQADAGKVFVLDVDCATAFSTCTPLATAGSMCGMFSVIATQAVGDDCMGMMLYSGGPVTVMAHGNIARGEYVRMASVIGKVATTCVMHTHHRPVPRGSIGIATDHSAGGCVSIIKFPYPAPGAPGQARVHGFMGNSGAAATTFLMDSSGIVLADACNDVVVVPITHAIDVVTNDITVGLTNKKNGRDQDAAFTAGWIHFHYVWDALEGKLYSRSSVQPITPTLPACETHWGRAAAVYYDGVQLRNVRVRGFTHYHACGINVLSGGNATTETAVNISSGGEVPTDSLDFGMLVHTRALAAGDELRLRYITGSCDHFVHLATASALEDAFTVQMPTGSNAGASAFFYLVEGITADACVLWYRMPG